MRILLDYRPALRDRSGVGEFVHGLARALATRPGDDELAILTTSWKDRPAPDLASELPGVAVVDRRIPVRALTWMWNRMEWPPVEWLAGAADVVHAQAPVLIPASRAAQVITIHDLHFLARPDRSVAEMRRDFPALVHEHARRADHIVVSSAYAAGEVVRELHVPPDRITVCPPGAPEWAAGIAAGRASRQPGSAILFVGTLDLRKNIPVLLDAYAELRARRPDAPPLVLAGRVTEAVRIELGRTERSPLAGHVTVSGYVTHEERQRLYREARMLVLPSLEEGFGLPVLEAMACGLPVVVSNRGALPEVAGDAASPIDPLDADALATEMERLLDPGAAGVAAANGLVRAAHYTWDATADAARTAYRAAIAARARRAG